MAQLTKEEQGISVQTLCSLSGKSRNAWYESQRKIENDVIIRDVVLQEVNRLRAGLPGIGTRKLHYMLQDILPEHNMAVGRDYLLGLLAASGLLITGRRRRFITTDSNHWMKKYDNPIVELLQPFDLQSRIALLDTIEDRHQKRSTVVTSQIPVKEWYDIIGEKTIADAVLDRIVHHSLRVELFGESLRRRNSKTENVFL